MKRILKVQSRGKFSLKGQFSVEFFTVLILFVGFAAYFSFRLLEVKPVYIREVKKAIIRSEVYRISEVLINDPGSPMDWSTRVGTSEEHEIKRVGLSSHLENKTNFLSTDKISAFDSLCNGGAEYDTIKDLVGAHYNFSITLLGELPGTVIFECSAPEFGENPESINRLVVFDSGEYGELRIQAW